MCSLHMEIRVFTHLEVISIDPALTLFVVQICVLLESLVQSVMEAFLEYRVHQAKSSTKFPHFLENYGSRSLVSCKVSPLYNRIFG